MADTLIDCAKPGCGFATEGRTPREAQARMTRHMSRGDHMAFARRQRAQAAVVAQGHR